MSAVKRILQNNFVQRNEENYLLRDSGYLLEPWLLVRYPHVIPSSPEENFNATLSRIRTIIAHVNGLLTTRFRCLHEHRALHVEQLKLFILVRFYATYYVEKEMYRNHQTRIFLLCPHCETIKMYIISFCFLVILLLAILNFFKN